MTLNEVRVFCLQLHGEYLPSDGSDGDFIVAIDPFLNSCVWDFIYMLPTLYTPHLVSTLNDVDVIGIDYHGGFIVLPDDFGRFISFYFNEWERSLGLEDVISDSNPLLKLQRNKFTSGGTSRPVIHLGHHNGVRGLSFWGYRKSKDAGNSFSYLMKTNSLFDILNLEDWLVKAYCYYVLHSLYISIGEAELSKVALLKMEDIFSIHEIKTTQPPVFDKKDIIKK